MMSGAPAGNDDEVDFDRLENEASKVFALWEIMGTAPPGTPAAAAPAVESALDALEAAALKSKEATFEAASTAQDMPAVKLPEAAKAAEPEMWAADAGKTTIDGRALPRMEEALAPAAPVATAAAFAPTVEAPLGAFSPDASLPDVTQAHAALPPIAAVAPPQTRPAEMGAPQVKTVSQPPSDMFSSPSVAPVNKTVVFGSQTGPIAKNAEQPLQVQQFPDQTIRAEALDVLPERKAGGMVWIGAAAVVLLAATGGLIWMASGSTEAATPTATVTREESRPVPLPSGLPPSATATPPVTAPVVQAPTPVAPTAPVVAAPVVAAPVAEAPVAPAPVVAPPVEAPVARVEPPRAERVEPRVEPERRRIPSTIRRRLPTTTSMSTSMQSTGTSMRPSTLMGDNPYK